jgi:hypothetical protein
VSVARDYGFDIMAPQMAEIYVSSTTADALRRTYALEPSARANVVLHVVRRHGRSLRALRAPLPW